MVKDYILYEEDDSYNSSNKTVTLTLTKTASTTATITNNTIDNTTINIHITDEKTGIPVNGGVVEVVDTANNLVVELRHLMLM